MNLLGNDHMLIINRNLKKIVSQDRKFAQFVKRGQIHGLPSVPLSLELSYIL